MIVAARLITDRRRSLLWWALGMVGLVLFTVSLYPSVKDQQSIDDLIKDLPDTVRTMVGYQVDIPLTSPAGFVNARLFATVAPVVVLVFGIGAGTRAIGGAEEDGTLEQLLAQPVSRDRVAVERYLATIALLAAVVALFTVALLALAPLFGALDGIPVTHVLGACTAVYALALLHTTPSAPSPDAAAPPSPSPPLSRCPDISSRACSPRPEPPGRCATSAPGTGTCSTTCSPTASTPLRSGYH